MILLDCVKYSHWDQRNGRATLRLQFQMKDHRNPPQHNPPSRLCNPVHERATAPSPKNAVFTVLKGGFGNQLFQYAAGLQLSRRLGVRLYVDLRWFESSASSADTQRTYNLHHLRLAPDQATQSQLKGFMYPENAGAIRRRVYQALRRLRRHTLFIDSGIGWQPVLTQLSAPVLIEGYFQSTAHLEGIQEELRHQAVPKTPPPENIAALSHQLSASDSVCIQVRRSDYLKSQASAQFHGCCTEDYYRRAWAAVKEKRPNAQAFIFPDDHEWAQTLKALIPGAEIVPPDFDGPDYMHKFHLMRSCRHFIIANSTWGWWAAWLGAQKDSIVIMPERWFANDEANRQAVGLRVPGWLLL